MCDVRDPDGGKAPPDGHTLFARTFSVGSRRFLLYGEFGSPSVTETQLQALNDVLATLEIDADGALGPTDPGAAPTVLPQGPSFTAAGTTLFDYIGLRLAVPPGWTALAAPLTEPAVAPVSACSGHGRSRPGHLWPRGRARRSPRGRRVGMDRGPSGSRQPRRLLSVPVLQARPNSTTHAVGVWFRCAITDGPLERVGPLPGNALALGPFAEPSRVAEVEALLNSLRVT